ncbi:glycosyltransferase family 4 protein [Niveispirillum sp. BGYR6]|uniref:glycosyltransferase family 4 protein n=1 Tax=Niveispirillum sp. BGYR6 TaxID=2971249 RepID=UPI0022B9D146|nr:glycosyltransferase family 4 protein [Niveispirillum sp. BGYR6]MDG5496496.1 glycosyltransferase family 4 protein [Niveispirillum sp. BGYR6]
MQILFVHQNFPGQFKSLVPALLAAGHQITALAIEGAELPGIRFVRYRPLRGSSPNIHPWVTDFEAKVIRGEACAGAAEGLLASGYRPDIIVGHPGWGEMLFLRDIWPGVPQLHFLEFYYTARGSDVNFDPEFARPQWQSGARVRAKNSCGLISLEQMDAGYSPTEWQRVSYPSFARPRVEVVHDGINTDLLTPRSDASLTLADRNLVLRPGMKVVTFINRNLEPYRGYHSFMRALPQMQRLVPDAFFVVVGRDGVSYGAKAPEGKSWKEIFLAEVADRIDLSRVAFVGHIPYAAFVSLMQISAAHVYLTYPFVLSWSMLEAMSCGAPVIGSATPPVQEVIEHGHNGLLVDFFDYDGLAAVVAEVLNQGQRYRTMRQAARQTVIDRYDLHRICLPRQQALINRVAG